MSEQGEIYFDRETGKAHTTARSLIDAYIARFSSRVSAAVGSQVRFKPLDDDGYSFVVRGSATVGINVMEEQRIILLLARIMEVPRDNECGFYRKLLELNYSATAQGAFAIDEAESVVYLRAARSVAGLDYEEFEEMLDTVATVADDWDDRLIAEFGGG